MKPSNNQIVVQPTEVVLTLGEEGEATTAPTSIAELTDVNFTSLQANDYLKWNGSSWVNAVFPTFSNYGDSNVNFHLNSANAASGQVLSWNGTDYQWVDQASGSSSYGDNEVSTHLNTGSASSGQILSWNGTDFAWVNDQVGSGGGGSSVGAFGDLSDVTITSAAENQFLKYVGGQWVNVSESPGAGNLGNLLDVNLASGPAASQDGTVLVYNSTTNSWSNTSTPLLNDLNIGDTHSYSYTQYTALTAGDTVSSAIGGLYEATENGIMIARRPHQDAQNQSIEMLAAFTPTATVFGSQKLMLMGGDIDVWSSYAPMNLISGNQLSNIMVGHTQSTTSNNSSLATTEFVHNALPNYSLDLGPNAEINLSESTTNAVSTISFVGQGATIVSKDPNSNTIRINSNPNGLPSQSSAAGKFLTSDGTSASWATIGSVASGFSGNVTFTNSTIDTSNSSDITFTPDVVFSGDISADSITSTSTGIPNITSSSSVNITAPSGVNINNNPVATEAYVQSQVASASLPSQTSNGGKVLTTDGTSLSWEALTPGAGTITEIVPGTGMAGSTVTSGSATIGLTQNVIPSTIGGHTFIPRISIDSTGRITSYTEVPVTAATGIPDPTVATDGYYLKTNGFGMEWAPVSAVSSQNASTGDITFANNSVGTSTSDPVQIAGDSVFTGAIVCDSFSTSSTDIPEIESASRINLTAPDGVFSNGVPLPTFGGSLVLNSTTPTWTGSTLGATGVTVDTSNNASKFRIYFASAFASATNYNVSLTFQGDGSTSQPHMDVTRNTNYVEIQTYNTGNGNPVTTGTITVLLYEFS